MQEGQGRFLCNQIGWKKKERKRKKRGSRTGLHPWWRVKVRRGPHIWGNPSPAGPSAGVEGKLRGLEGESSSHAPAGRTEGKPHRWSRPQPWAPQPEVGVRQCAQGREERGIWRAGPGRRLLLAMRKQSEGMANQEYSWRRSGHCRRQAPLLSDAHCSGATAAASLLTHWPRLWSEALRALRGAPVDPTHTPLPPLPLPSPTTLAAAHSNCVSAPSCLRVSCAPATSGTDPGGRNTHKSGSETTAETQRPYN